MSVKNNFNDNFYENTSIEFESLLNNINEWENNPIEASRYCLKNLYNIIRYQEKKIEIINKNKISNSEYNRGLNAKTNISDFMSAINDISQNIEKRPTLEQIKLLLNDNIYRKEINEVLKNKTSLEEVKSNLENGNIKISIDNIKEDLNRNCVHFKNLSDILSTKPNKETILNLLNQKANINDIEKINKELKNLNFINNKIQEIENNFNEIITKINQQIEKINNDNNTMNKINYNNIVKQLNEIELKFNNYSNSIDSNISDIDKKINLIKNKYDLLDKEIKSYEDNFKEFLNKENENKNKSPNYQNNIEEKINSINKDINKIFEIIENVLSKYENDSKELQRKISLSKTNSDSNQEYITSQEIDNIYSSICHDIFQKFIDIDNYTKNNLNKIKIEIMENIDSKASNEEINSIKLDLNKIKLLLEQKSDLNSIDYILNDINLNYVNKKEFENFMGIYQNSMEEMKNDLILKSNIEETMNFLKNKADINDVNNALNQIHDELDIKLSFQDFNHAMNNINKINSALLQNNQVGEWIWESGIVKNNHFILWEIQKINNCPENFIWNQDSDTIVVKQKGIYLFNLAIFMYNPAIVHLYINGEKFLSRNFDDKEESGFKYNLKNNVTNENLTGTSINEFLLLQEKSRISIYYEGSDNVKGILSLKLLSNI